MFKVNFVVVGKIKESWYESAIEEYKKRLQRFCSVSVYECKEESLENLSPAVAIKRESEEILKKTRGYVSVFAIEGKKFTSESFAKKIAEIRDKGEELTFVIGSSCGLDESVKARADMLISFSDMTFPHSLFRVMAFEQVYRAFMIDGGGKYHK